MEDFCKTGSVQRAVHTVQREEGLRSHGNIYGRHQALEKYRRLLGGAVSRKTAVDSYAHATECPHRREVVDFAQWARSMGHSAK